MHLGWYLYHNTSDNVSQITHQAADPWPKLFTSRGMNQIILLKTCVGLIQQAYNLPNLLDRLSVWTHLCSTMIIIITWSLTHQWEKKKGGGGVLCNSCLENLNVQNDTTEQHAAFLNEKKSGKRAFPKKTQIHMNSLKINACFELNS